MREHLIEVYRSSRRYGIPVVNDEGNVKGYYRKGDPAWSYYRRGIPEGYRLFMYGYDLSWAPGMPRMKDDPLVRASQYVRKLRRLENRRRHKTLI